MYSFERCAICYEDSSVHAPVELECGHVFHNVCILVWLVRCATCPMCRKQVDVSCINTDISEKQIDELMTTPYFTELSESFELSEGIMRRYMDTVFNEDRDRVVENFYTYQYISEQFIIDYINEVHIDTILSRTDELDLSERLTQYLVDIDEYITKYGKDHIETKMFIFIVQTHF